MDVRGPIIVVPLCTTSPCEVGGSSRRRGDALGPAAKRAMLEPSEQVERAESNSVSSGVRVVSTKRHVENIRRGGLARVGGDVVMEIASIASLFGLARLPLDISSYGDASSDAYLRGTQDTEAALEASQAPTGMITLSSLSFFSHSVWL